MLRLFDDLWARYRRRVSFVRTYEQIVRDHGAKFVNDHIAFRTIALQQPGSGIFTLSRLFQALGYSPRACYEFPDKHMSSIHMSHPHPQFPKLFVTELKTWELSEKGRKIIHRTLKSHRLGLSTDEMANLHRLDQSKSMQNKQCLKRLIRFFSTLPWKTPAKQDVVELDTETQFGAWVLLNGYDVNHFTASVNSHGAPSLDTIDKTVDALKKAGVPMKKEIEGAPGSILRQSSTEAVRLPFRVKEKGRPVKMDWTYAYFELAERGPCINPATGESERFEGFLGPQATHLFDMTKLQNRR